MNNNKENYHKVKVGLFDSGIGGLPVYNQLINDLKARGFSDFVSVLYLGDTKNFPYGTKTTKQLTSIVSKNISLLKEKGCDIVGIACNTASIIYNHNLSFDPHVIPVINIAATTAAKLSRSGVHVISSQYTANSRKYKKYINAHNISTCVTEKNEQLLIKAIEDKDLSSINKHVSKIITSLDKRTDVLVLGCTHFSYIRNVIESNISVMKKQIKIVDPTQELTQKIISKVEEFQFHKTGSAKFEISFTGKVPPKSHYLFYE